MKKLKKHIKIAGVRLKGMNTLKRMLQAQNQHFNSVINAILDVKKGRFTEGDLVEIAKCESIRKDLLQNQKEISFEVFNNPNPRTVAQICKRAASPEVWARLLFALIKKSKEPVSILELGSNVGVSGAYMVAAANEGSQLITMEGVPGLVKVAFNAISKSNELLDKNIEFEVVEGLFSKTFDSTIEKAQNFDFVFIDGNHKYEPTLKYFRSVADRNGRPCVFVFDDINWDGDMKRAWAEICTDKRSNFVIDLYRQGIVLYDPNEMGPNLKFDYHLAY